MISSLLNFEFSLDVAAVLWFVLLVGIYRVLAEWGPFERRSIVGAVQHQRLAWMRNMAIRENRMIDVILVGNLGQGNAFFASTSVIAIGGLTAIMGSGEHVQAMLERLPYVTKVPLVLWETKVIFIVGTFIFAFFKFAWSFRLSHCTAIMIGAAPILREPYAHDCDHHAELTAKMIGLAADHTNSGIRAFYYAIAAMAWFFHPLLFMSAAT